MLDNTAATTTTAKKTRKAAPKGKAKKAKAKPKKSAASKGRTAQYSDDARIKVLVSENPRRAGTDAHAKFACIKDGDTVAQVMAKGEKKGFNLRGHLASCVKRKQISIKG